MRLIDANKLHYHRELIDKLDRGIGSAVVVYAKEIDKAPLVEAIPIEWLRELQTKYLEAECYMSICVVNEILNLWRKENETENN